MLRGGRTAVTGPETGFVPILGSQIGGCRVGQAGDTQGRVDGGALKSLGEAAQLLADADVEEAFMGSLFQGGGFRR